MDALFLSPSAEASLVGELETHGEGRLIGALRVRMESIRSYVEQRPPSVAGGAAAGESASGARMRERVGTALGDRDSDPQQLSAHQRTTPR
jgi:hypothetical protein